MALARASSPSPRRYLPWTREASIAGVVAPRFAVIIPFEVPDLSTFGSEVSPHVAPRDRSGRNNP